MKKLLPILIIVGLTQPLFGQYRTFAGVELALTNDQHTLASEPGVFGATQIPSFVGGITLRQDIHRFALETGLLVKDYPVGSRGDSLFGFTEISSGMVAWHIPLRLRYKLNLYRNKVIFAPLVGVHGVLNASYGARGSDDSTDIPFGGNALQATASVNTNLTRLFWLMETGAGLEFNLSNGFLLTASLYYLVGFADVMEYRIRYTFNQEAERTALLTSRGTHWRFGIGVQYQISRLWAKGSVPAYNPAPY